MRVLTQSCNYQWWNYQLSRCIKLLIIKFSVFVFLLRGTKCYSESGDNQVNWDADLNPLEDHPPNVGNLQGHDHHKNSRFLVLILHECIVRFQTVLILQEPEHLI